MRVKNQAKLLAKTALITSACLLAVAGCSKNDGSNTGALQAGTGGALPIAGAGAAAVGGGTVLGGTTGSVAGSGAAGTTGVPLAGSGGAAGTAVIAGVGGIGGSAGAAGSGSAGTGSAPPTPDPPGTVMLSMDPWVLQPNQEIYKCQNFDNPFGGKDEAVSRIVTDMSKGSHHLHVYHMATSATRTLEDCTIQDFHPLMHAASKPHAETMYPAGMAAKLNGTDGVRVQVHYINLSDDPVNVITTVKMSPADPSTITKWVSELYFNRLKLDVPAHKNTTITTTCAVPQGYGQIGLVYGGSHTHSRGKHFSAMTSTGVTLANVDGWEDLPDIVYDPPVMLNPGDTITWSCDFENNTDMDLMFGESAATNEMCIYLARFYSAPDGAQLECEAQASTGNFSYAHTN